MTAESLIIPGNVRARRRQLGLTVQGLINSKPSFWGCLICNARSLIFLSLFFFFKCLLQVLQRARLPSAVGQGEGSPTDLRRQRSRCVIGAQGAGLSLAVSDLELNGDAKSVQDAHAGSRGPGLRSSTSPLPVPRLSQLGAFPQAPLFNPKASFETKTRYLK